MSHEGKLKVTRSIKKTMPDGTELSETITEYRENEGGSSSGFFSGFSLVDPAKLEEDFANFQVISSQADTAAIQLMVDVVEAEEEKEKEDEEEEVRRRQAEEEEKRRKKAEEDEFGEWTMEGLRSHNAYRKKHGADPLKLSKKLCNFSQEWANKLAREGTIYHRTNSGYGENIYMCSISPHYKAQDDASDAVSSWYSEISQYSYGSGFSMSTGHFTQVVWCGSKELGIARARGNGMSVIVANYSPAGNMQGAFTQNVKPTRPC